MRLLVVWCLAAACSQAAADSGSWKWGSDGDEQPQVQQTSTEATPISTEQTSTQTVAG